jgi:superfamily II DNA or RNA helicase
LTLRLESLDLVRAAIARCWLDGRATSLSAAGETSASLGRIVLHPHQSDAVQQLLPLLEEHRGAVLADTVGLGKTYVALAVAREAKRTLVVCPAGLRDMWSEASDKAGIAITMITMESLSRMPPPVDCSTRGKSRKDPPHGEDPLHTAPPRSAKERFSHYDPDLVIVDEAHHVRNPHTRRYRSLSHLTARARVLLLTATPVHNRIADLSALLSLFLGARAWTLTEDQRARYVIRRRREFIGAEIRPRSALPEIVGPTAITLADDTDTLARIVTLPPALPPHDGEACEALTAIGLLRQWSSSAGALRAALRRRLERAGALEAALERNAYPTYRDLRDWCLGDGAVQLALYELLMPDPFAGGASSDDGEGVAAAAELLVTVRRHASAVRTLLSHLAQAPDLDIVRADRLRSIVRSHASSKIVAFSAYEDTVRTLFRLLCADGRVCALSARGGVIASGRLRRAEVIAQFGPTAPSRATEAERIDLLLTTDLLSEGVNLQGAAVVVHLDLPWTPARIEQRVGRIARLGSAHANVHVYALSPPATAEALLNMERRLQAKLDTARRAVGIAGSILPLVPMTVAMPAPTRLPQDAGPLPPLNRMERLSAAHPGNRNEAQASELGPPESIAAVRMIVTGWRRPIGAPGPGDTICACATGPTGAFLAACVAAGRPVLLANVGAGVTDAPDAVAAAVRLAGGADQPANRVACAAAERAIAQWWAEQRAAEDAGLTTIAGAVPRLRVLGRIAAITRRAPLHARPLLLALGDRARRAAVAPFGSGAEWVLDQLAGATMPDAQWLRAIAAFGEAHSARPDATESPPDRGIRVVALICGVTTGARGDGARTDGV